jgi:ATP-dependent DNA helicase RecQ
LLKNNLQAKLIQSNDGFNLYNLVEIRSFLNLLRLTEDTFVIHDDHWENAKRELKHIYSNSSKLDICLNIIKDFETINTNKKYKSDLITFIRDSKLEDFYNENGETIFVSTIHKAKGREFDNVFLLLEKNERFDAQTDIRKRELYVAFTRAKQNLTIHINEAYLNQYNVDEMVRIHSTETYLPPNEIVMHLTYKDIWLDYFINKQNLLAPLMSGQSLYVGTDECLNSKGQSILKFSQLFMKQIEIMKEKNFELKNAKINHIVYWLKEGTEEEIKIVLPELYFQRISNPS